MKQIRSVSLSMAVLAAVWTAAAVSGCQTRKGLVSSGLSDIRFTSRDQRKTGAFAHFMQGLLYEKSGRFASAAAEFKTAAGKDPQAFLPRAHLALARQRGKSGRSST